MDPADPYFQFTDPLVRLDPSDAQFVDVLHTDGESILKLGKGICSTRLVYSKTRLGNYKCRRNGRESLKYVLISTIRAMVFATLVWYHLSP